MKYQSNTCTPGNAARAKGVSCERQDIPLSPLKGYPSPEVTKPLPKNKRRCHLGSFWRDEAYQSILALDSVKIYKYVTKRITSSWLTYRGQHPATWAKVAVVSHAHAY